MPRFAPAAWAANLALLYGLRALAEEVGATTAQLALAWVFSQAEHVLGIPGTTQPTYLHDNLGAADLMLSPAQTAQTAQTARLEAAVAPQRVAGHRHGAAAQAEVDTEARRRSALGRAGRR